MHQNNKKTIDGRTARSQETLFTQIFYMLLHYPCIPGILSWPTILLLNNFHSQDLHFHVLPKTSSVAGATTLRFFFPAGLIECEFANEDPAVAAV